MTALGALHKCVLGKAPPTIAAIFPSVGVLVPAFETRLAVSRHSRQLLDPVRGNESRVLKRSLFGSVRVRNSLLEETVRASTVASFQLEFKVAVRRSLLRRRNWQASLTHSSGSVDIRRFQRFFFD